MMKIGKNMYYIDSSHFESFTKAGLVVSEILGVGVK